MIVEGLVTTRSASGEPHLAPMGPRVELDMQRLILRPFATSTTFANLRRDRQGVFHLTDDVELLARAAVGRVETMPAMTVSPVGRGYILDDCCRWFEFQVVSLDESGERMHLECKVTGQGRVRDFLGFNRAKHAVVEAAILATRWQWIPETELQLQISRLLPLVEKTGGEQEQRAFQFLVDHLRRAYGTAGIGTSGLPDS